MRIRPLSLFLLLFLSVTGVSAQSSILPDQAGSWQAQGPAKTVDAKELGSIGKQVANVNQVLKEAGLSRIDQRTYGNGQDTAAVRVFVLKDPSSAYELYTFLLSPDMQPLSVGDGAASSQDQAHILVGNYVVEATLSPKVKPDSLAPLVKDLKAKADPTPYPPLRNYLPERWRVFGSEKYAQGPDGFRAAMNSSDQSGNAGLADDVGFQMGAEAMLARFQGQKGSGTLLLIEYPNPQIAENHLHHIEQALTPAAKAAGVTVERNASLLSLVFNATSPMHAKAIRDEINYHTEVTWNEPSTTATDPPLVLVLFKIFLFTSLFLVVATVTGLFFGGVRVLVKHWLPGKVFDRPQDIEVLQLGLSGKKIDPTDMY
ncbi:MAG TPA: DUF6599 family protein [Dongiaceae bacterium]|nr:DUF6599 family protein [Dongiaceae bacterium]